MLGLFKAIFLFMLLTVSMIFCGDLLGGRIGMTYALILALLMAGGVYGFSDKLILRMYRALPLGEEEAPEVFEIVRGLSGKAGIPMPRVYLLPSAAANAFVVGRDPKHAAVAVTHGMVRLLNKEELAGVLGHELSHILNGDIFVSTAIGAFAGSLGQIAILCQRSLRWSGGESENRARRHPIVALFISVLMPFVAGLIQFTISHAREYAADRRGAGLCEDPLYLASALRKVDVASKQTLLRDAQPATAHLFIINPLSGRGWSSLFNTHPPVEERIIHLEKILVTRALDS